MIRDGVRKILIFGSFIIFGIMMNYIIPVHTWASSESDKKQTTAPSDEASEQPGPWYKNIDDEWGGHVKIRGSVSWPDDESYFKYVGTDPCYDGFTELRIKNKLFLGLWGDFVTHYEAVFSGGDIRRKEKSLEQLYPDLFGGLLKAGGPPDDSRRLMDLTDTIDDDDNYIFYHRLDRLYMTVMPEWGVVRVGRQAVTWGNGLLFNPMDLFNPFSPSDIEREYKIGDDMVFTQFSVDSLGNVQLLYVPRRETASGDVDWDQSSLAGKLHSAHGTTEFDIMAAKHYKDTVVGIGSTGYLGDTAWRLDGVWTFLDNKGDSDDYLSLVANIDYSWVWLGKNFYGYGEYYFNGLCHNRYTESYADQNISDRIERGELYTVGRNYLSGHVRAELHPLFNVYLTVINNVEDPSGAFQPRATWDITQNVQITMGGTVYYGGRDTEYGGYKIAGTDFFTVPSDSGFLWLSYYY